MTQIIPRDKNLIAMGIAMILAFSVAAYCLGAITGPKYIFYDGEGNIIPYRAVDSLVRAQFGDEGKAGRDTISKYFN